VIHCLQPYPAYRDSGVPWLGKVPQHWEVRKLRHCGSILGGMTPSMENSAFWDGNTPWITPKDMKRFAIGDSITRITDRALRATSLREIPAGSVLLVVRGMILARRARSRKEFVKEVPITAKTLFHASMPQQDR
jgi:type I restriction enzyme, S subunit